MAIEQTRPIDPTHSKPAPPESVAQSREAFTLIDPNLFCVEGAPEGRGEVARLSQQAALSLSGASRFAAFSSGTALKTVGRVLGPVTASASAALTTANLHHAERTQRGRQARIQAAAEAFRSEKGVDWQTVIPDIVAAEQHTRNNVADKVGIAGDYIAAGSAFLLTFPPAAAAGFAAGIAVKAGGELGKHIERRTIKNIYDLLAESAVKGISPNEVEKLWYLLESRGISSDANHRLEVWAFCRALEKLQAKSPSQATENLLSWLEEKLLMNLDARTNDQGFAGQIDRELGPTLAAGQVTLSWAEAPRQSIQRLQAPASDSNAFSALLPARIEGELNRTLKQRAMSADISSRIQNWPSPAVLKQATQRAIIATLGDFDAASMMAAKIAYRLYVDTAGKNEAIAYSDMHAYHDCHFILSATQIDVIRCGVFQVRSADEAADTAYIPYLRKVSVPINAEAQRIQEHFDLLSDRWYDSPDAAAQQLPSQGIPSPLMDWHVCEPAQLASQLALVATQLEKTDFTALSQGQGTLPLILAETSATRDSEGNAAPRRCFMAPDSLSPAEQNRRARTADGVSRAQILEDLAVAVTRLITAACARTSPQGESRGAVTAAALEAELSVRQQLLRGVKDWQHHWSALMASGASQNAAQTAWQQQCQQSFEKAVRALESSVLQLTEQYIAASLK